MTPADDKAPDFAALAVAAAAAVEVIHQCARALVEAAIPAFQALAVALQGIDLASLALADDTGPIGEPLTTSALRELLDDAGTDGASEVRFTGEGGIAGEPSAN